MPPKKDNKLSKAELMARKRASMTDEEKALQRQADKERKADKRNRMSEQEKEEKRKADSRRKAEKRAASKTPAKKIYKCTWPQFERENNRKYKVRIRENRSEAEHEYEKIYNLICMRKLRAERTVEDHQIDKSQAQAKMKLAREFGYLKPCQNRARGIKRLDEMGLWMHFYEKGTKYRDVLKEKNPDIATQLQEVIDQRRKEKEEKEAIEKKKRNDGFWEFNYNMDRWIWTGINPPGPENPDPNVHDPDPICPWSDEEFRKMCEEGDAAAAEMRRLAKNRKERERYNNRKKDLLEPIEIPEFELSEYERIREQNIKEREDALRAAGFKW